jgi:hypothetical protein
MLVLSDNKFKDLSNNLNGTLNSPCNNHFNPNMFNLKHKESNNLFNNL